MLNLKLAAGESQNRGVAHVPGEGASRGHRRKHGWPGSGSKTNLGLVGAGAVINMPSKNLQSVRYRSYHKAVKQNKL